MPDRRLLPPLQTYAALLESFKADQALRTLAPSTRRVQLWVVGRFLRWCETGGYDPCQVDLTRYLAWHRSKGIQLAAIQNAFSHLAVFFDYLQDRGLIQQNPIPKIQKKYLKEYKEQENNRRILSLDEAGRMIRATMDTRDQAILVLLFKTGIRLNELVSLDVADLDLDSLSCTLKRTAKRSNRLIFYDEEAARVLSRWLKSRDMRRKEDKRALFLTASGVRLGAAGVQGVIRQAAERVGLQDSRTPREERVTPHCARHFVATHLLRAGMSREHVQFLRGDAIREAVDIYYHISPDDVRREYLRCVPRFGL